MRPDSRWVWMLILILGGLVIYAAFPLLVHGIILFLAVTIGLLLAIPRELWWFIGIAVLTLAAIKPMLRLATHLLRFSEKSAAPSKFRGRLAELRHTFESASKGDYSKDSVRQLLRFLAIDLIMLELDTTEDEARRSFLDKTWTRNEALKSYLYKERDFKVKRPRRLRGSKGPDFLEETKEALDYLEDYRKFGNQGGNDRC